MMRMGLRAQGMRASHWPATSSITIIFESWPPMALSNLAAAQKPIAVMMMVAKMSNGMPPSQRRAMPKGRAPRLPHVPGAGLMKPQPNQLASQT